MLIVLSFEEEGNKCGIAHSAAQRGTNYSVESACKCMVMEIKKGSVSKRSCGVSVQ